MTPQDFIAKWGAPDGVPGPAYTLNEEQGAQSHFLDLCELLAVPKPGSEDGYRFEEKSAVIGGKTGYADVFKRGVFAWENKTLGKNLDTAHQRVEVLPGGASIPADIYKENQSLAQMNQGQVATNTILTSAAHAKPTSTSKAGVVRRSGAILKSNAYEPSACGPVAPGESPQPVAHHHASPSTSKSAAKGLREHAIAIAQAAKKLNDLREAWLNPPEWSHRVPEVVPLGLTKSPYPDRIEPRPGISEADLKALQKRTLTNLYNAKPAWLTLAHQQLDLAVAAAYGWADYSPAMADDEILKRLLALNLARSAAS